jgi:hypothetical protein
MKLIIIPMVHYVSKWSRHLTLFWVNLIQSTSPYSISWDPF